MSRLWTKDFIYDTLLFENAIAIEYAIKKRTIEKQSPSWEQNTFTGGMIFFENATSWNIHACHHNNTSQCGKS